MTHDTDAAQSKHILQNDPLYRSSVFVTKLNDVKIWN